MATPQEIGIASKSNDFHDFEGGIVISIPYGIDRYNIAFSDEDLEKLLSHGTEVLLGGVSLVGCLDFKTPLEDGDLSLLVGPSSIDPRAKAGCTRMGVTMLSSSFATGYRGTALVDKGDADCTWALHKHLTLPPLYHPKAD